jgi:hypothetical protein
MDIKAIIRRLKVGKIIPNIELSSDEKELLTFLDDIFKDFEKDECVKMDGNIYCCYKPQYKTLWHSFGFHIVFKKRFKISYSQTRKILKDYIEHSFGLEIIEVV